MEKHLGQLDKLAAIEPGQTYNLKTSVIVTHNSLYGWYTRYMGVETRSDLHTWLYQLYLRVFEYYNMADLTTKEMILSKVIKSRPGIESLRLTYYNYQDVDFREILSLIDCSIAKVKGSYCLDCGITHQARDSFPQIIHKRVDLEQYANSY